MSYILVFSPLQINFLSCVRWGQFHSFACGYPFFPAPLIYLFIFSFIFISWKLITLQYCSVFCHTLTWISHGFTCVPHPNPPSRLPPHPIPSLWVFPVHQPWALVSCIQPGLWSLSPLIIYLFQCYSLRSSHPHLLPQSPKVCSVYLCLFFCFAYRVIITIF